MKKLILITLLIATVILFMNLGSAQNFVFEKDQALDLKIACFDEDNEYCNASVQCNLTIFTKNHTLVVNNQNMTYNQAFWNYSLNASQMSVLGQHSVITICSGNTTGFSTFTYEITPTGNPTPSGMPTFQMGVIIIIFATACFLLYLSAVMHEVGLKIFFLLTSLIFLMATLLTGYMVSVDGNVAAEINTTTLALIVVLGFILFIIFIWIIIRQTINALDMLKINKGLGMDPDYNVGLGRRVGGYDTRKAY